MASDFEQFMNRMLGQAMPQAPQVPVAPTPQPMMPTPQAPAQSAYSSPMPAQLAQLIERAAQMAQAQRPAPQTDSQFYTQALQSQGVDPRSTASTAPVQGPTQAPQQPQQKDAPNGYVLVDFQTAPGVQGNFILVPVGLTLPDNARVMGDGEPITDPAGIDRARQEGRLLEQQAPAIQQSFTTSQEQMGIGVQRAQSEGRTPLTDAGIPNLVGGPAARTDEQEAQVRSGLPSTTVAPSAPGAMEYQNQPARSREQEAPTQPTERYTTEELKNSGIPELVQLGTQLEASGYTEYSTDQDVMVDPSTGRITLQPKDQEAPVEGPPAPDGEPVGTPLPELTTDAIRAMDTTFAGGTMTPDAVAREMERQQIYAVPDGQMLVMGGDGTLQTVPAADQAPAGTTFILYGGQSTRPDPSILGSPMEAVVAVRDVLDASRRKAVELTSGALTSKPVEWWVENVTSPVWNALLSDEAVEHFMTEVYPTITAPIAPLALQSWIANNPEKVAEVEQNGWDANGDGTADYTGNEAIWEAFIDEQPEWARVLYDLEMDPLNWATGGGNIARLGARELLTNPNVTRRISGEALDIVGRILRSPDVAVDKIIQGTGLAVGLAIKNTLGTVPIVKLTLDTLKSPTVQSAVSRATRPVQQATDDVMAFLRQAEGGVPPAGTAPTDGPTPPPIGSRPPTDPRSPTGGTINDLLNQVQRETDLATSGTAPRSATRDPLADIEGAAEQAGVPGPPEELFPRRTPREATDLPGDNPLIRTQNAADQAALDVSREQQGPRTIADMIREASEFGQRQSPTGPSVADPFEGTTLGEAIQQTAEEAAVPQRPDWEFASPQDGAGRMVDEVFAQRQAHAREVAEFTRVHDPKARRFLDDQRAKRQQSMDTKAERGGQWDREHSRQEVIDEGRYIVDEFIPDFQATMRGTDVQLPEYKFRQEPIGNKNLQNQTDEYLLEQLAFGPDRYTRGIRNILRNRIGTKGDATLQRYWDEAEAIRTKNQNLRSGMEQTTLPDEAAPEAAPAPTAPAADVAPDPVRELRRADVDWAEIQPQDAPVGPERNLYFDDGEVHQVRWDDQLNSWRATIGTDRWTDDIFDQGGFATRLEAEDAIAEQLDPGALVANAPDAWNDLVSQSTPLSDLPHWERSAIEDYESSGFAVNGRLRASEEVRDFDLKTIWPLDIATARTELPGGTTLYRASNDMRQGIQVSNLNPGDTFTDKGFMSTSTKQRRAEVHQTKDGVLFRITTEPGLTGRVVDAVTKVDQEIILPRGTQFTVTGITQGRKGKIIDLRARPGERGPDLIANADDSWAKSNIELARGYASESVPYDGSTASLRRVLGKPDTALSDAVAPNDPAMTPEPEPPRPAPEPEVPVSRERARAESRYQRLPIAEVRETTEMTDEALEAVGLFPSQFRRQKFSEQTADSVFKRKRVNMPPVQVMRGTDGELYVLDGHSRLEGLRRRGDTDVDVQIVEGTREELEEAAKTTNLSTTTHGPMGYADRARELADEGMSYDEIARELRQGNENWGKAGKQKAIDYHSAAFLPEDLATMFDQGTIPLNQAGELGRAIQDDVMTPAELQSFYTNVVVPEKLSAVDIRGEIARAAERKAGNNITGQRNALGFTDEELGSSGFWQGRAEEARIHKLIRKEEQNVRKWDERAKRPGTSLSASQKVDRQKSINRIAELRRELEPAPVESVAPVLPPTIDDTLTTQQAKPNNPVQELHDRRLRELDDDRPPGMWSEKRDEAKSTAIRESLESQTPDASSRWTVNQRDALQKYQRHTLNLEFRVGQQSDVSRALDDMATYDVPQGATIYRGESRSTRYKDAAVGDEITFPGHMSTSLNRKTALKYSTRNVREARKVEPVFMELRLGPQNRAVYIDKDFVDRSLSWQDQEELLFPTGTRIRVDEIVPPEFEGSKTFIRGTVLPPERSDVLVSQRPTDAPARPAAQAMDLGEAGRPVMEGGRTGTPGEALDVDDLLTPPERSPADVMRDSGAQPLFFQNNPKRGARNMFERTPGPLKVLTKPAPRRSGAPQAPNRFVTRDESALSTTEFSGVQIGQHNWRILNERFSNGDTYGDRWLKHVADVKDEQVARQADLSADAAKGAELTDAEAFEKAAGRVTHEVAVETLRDKSPKAFKAYQDEFTRLTTRKKDPIKDEWVARLRAFNHATANDSWWITRKYDYLLGMIREVILNNPITVGRYGLVNMLGNSVSAMLNDQPEIIGRALSRSNVGSALRESAPNEFVTTLINDPSSIVTRMFKYGHAQVDEPMTVDGVMSTIKDMGELPSVALHSPTESFAARMELGPQRHGVNTILRDQTTESVENPTKWANMVDSMRLGRHKVPAGTGGKVTGWIATRNGRDLANAMDVSFRTATWQSTMAANVAEGRTAFRDLMLQDLPRGADQARFNQLWDQLPNEFGPTRIREDFAEFGTNYADRMARDWTNAVGKMDENAREQVRRIFFSGDLTTADAYASRLILFHFWASRATPMYMKQLASHPGYMNAYIKLMENLEEQAQSGEFGKSVDGLLWLMKTPLGFNLFGRPDALFQTILSFGTQGNDFSPEGESGVAAWMRNSGLYFNPLIDFAFNMAGYQGDTFAPDPLALYNQRNLVITAWDLAKAHGWVEGDMPTADAQAEFLTWMRSHTSGLLPGTVNVPDTDTTLYAQQQINYLIQDVAEERGLDPVGPEAVAAMNDPESELYQEAFRRYADAGGLRLALKILPTSVLYPRLRIARPDEIRYELTDPNITEERKDELYDQRAVARAGSNESRTLEVQQDEYYDLGTPEQQEAYSTYEDIRQGTLSEPVTINGVRINGRVLEDLSDDERSNAANLWASQNGQTENVQAIRDERKAYRESHPEYDGFVKWRSDVYDNPDGVLAWWQDTVEGNPNAERWLESLEPLPQDELTRELTSIEAYMQWAGIRPTTYDADPLATRDMSNVPYSATEGSGSGSSDGGQQWSSTPKDPVTQINDQLTGYQQDMALYDSQVAAVFGQPVSMQNLPPNVRSSYEMILADHGIRPPSLGTEAGDYIRWRNAQRPGTDTSVNAYVNWQQQWMGNTNAVPATTTTTTPP